MVEMEADRDEKRVMVRPSIPAADAMIGREFKVLDHGFVMLTDYMGGDSSIVQAARTSYGSGTKRAREDEGLIRYLLRHQHTSPFEMVELKFLARMPIFVARQWVRHRTASINEYSARYSEVEELYYVPELESIQQQSRSNKQGRSGELPDMLRNEFREDVERISKEAYTTYRRHLDNGVARELARMVLPLNFYTQWYWKSDLHNIFHFLELRLDSHAQFETREYAKGVANVVKAVAPVAYKAFEDFVFNSSRFSSAESDALVRIMDGESIAEACDKAGLRLRKEDGSAITSGEGPEFVKKLDSIRERCGKP